MDESLRIGFGEDAHALAADRPLRLGGVAIEEAPRGAVAHSDGDALLHALADALLAAASAGDIGLHFPPSDPAHRGLDGRELLARVRAHLRDTCGPLRVVNVAAVITLDRPALAPYRDALRDSVAACLDLAPAEVNVAFKTSEGLAPDHVQARVSVLVRVGPAEDADVGTPP
ncbi:MAG: 2-C-methyl-D-erythritol 2,4-cyclodiphosphate synthase [Trueperaceae bacterium]|nr:2-C-methyl-D-erythritol 2,4-cyclodiphosphate synthase [Trueperaceae bacterium]